MPKSSKKTEQSSSHRSADSEPTTHKIKLDGPPKNSKKKKDGGGTNKKQKLSKKELKELEKQQRQKSYIAPTKPQPIKPDPLDSTGLVYVLPGELVIVLKNLGKKAVKTREKALDDLESGWVNSDRTKESSGQEHVLIDMLPVWLSHLPQLLLHPSRRIRLAATNIHRSLVNMPTILEHIRLQLEADGSESADVIGVWALASQDIDPAVASSASESWRKFVGASLSKAQILTYAQRAIVDPGALYAYLNPSPLRTPASAPMPHDKLTGNQKTQIHSKGAKGKTTPVKGKSTSSTPKTSAGNPDVKQLQGFDDPPLDSLETDTDRDARLRVSGLGALAWVLSASYLAETLDVLSDARLWSSLAGYDFGSFGFEQPPVRKAAWRLVGTVSGALGNFKPSVTAATQSSPSTDEKILKLLRILSFSVFHNAWTEQDAGVQGVMWQPLLRFLKDNPEAWQWEMGYNYTAEINLRMRDVDAGSDAGSDSDSESASSDGEDEDVRKGTEVPPFAASRAFKSFLSFLACGCNGSPIQAYPAVMVVLSTIPSSILLASYSSESVSSPAMPFTDLFSSFWAAVEPEHHPSSSSSGITVTSTITTPNRIFSGSGADKASKAFVEAVLDCLTFLVRRIVFQSQNATSETTADILGLSTLIRTQVKRVWVEVVGTGGATTTVDANGDPPVRKLVLRISPDVLGTSLARMLRGLRGIPGGPFYDDAWETVTQLIQDSAIEVSSTSTSIAAKDLSSFTSGVLKALQPSSVDSTDSTHSDAQQLLVTVFNIALDGCERSVTGINGSIAKGIGGLHLLTKFISTFGSESGIAAASDDVITRIDTFVVQNAYKLLSLERKEGFELLTTYLLCRDANSAARSTESSQAALTWLALLEQVVEYFHSQSGSQKAEFPVVLSYLLTLLDSLRSKRGGKVAVAKLRPIMNELDDMILEFAQDTVASGFSTLSSKLNLVRDVLLLTHHTKIAETISHPLLVPASLVKLVGMLVARFESGLRSLLGVGSEGRDQRGNQEEEKVSDSLDRMDRLLVLMEVILQLPPVNVVDSEQSKPGPSSSSYTASLPALPSTSVIPGIFLLAYALPRSSLSPQSVLATTEDETISHSRDNLCAKAQRIWESSIKLSNDVYGGARKDQPYHERIYSSVTQSLRTLLSKTNPACLYWCTAEDVVEVFEVLRNSMSLKTISLHSVTLEKNPINALLPSQDSFDVLLDRMSGAPISRSMSVVDELAGAASVFDPSSSDATSDMNDVRIYARYALALLYILSNDLGLAKGLFTASPGSWWVLRHLLVLGVYAGGTVSVPNAPNALYRNPLYHLAVLESDRAHRCREIIGKVHRIVAYIFTSAEFAEGATGEEGREWRKDVCRMLSAPNETSLSTIPSLSAFLFSIAHFSAKTDSYRDCCVLREVLSRLFQTGLGSGGRSEISEEEADLWLNYARRLSETEKGKSARAPLTGVTIMSTLVANLPSSLSSSTLAASFSFPRLERYRNELASSLLGVSPSRATSDGLRILLRLVLGTAPDVESEAEFLPVQRAVNVIKACQKWIEEGGDNDDASGEEGEQIAETGDGMEELESAMTLTFYHLAPILQNVAGGHWQFIFDVVENNIENCDFNFTKSSSASNSSLQLITLARTIRLVGHIQDLAATNRSLRAEWSERKGGIMKGIRGMILLDRDAAEEEIEASKRESNGRVETLDGPRSVPESMCHLLSSSTYSSVLYPPTNSHLSSSLPSFASSIHHDQLAYQILHKAAKKRTEHFVLEAGVDTEGKVKAQLPEELLVLLQQSVDLDIDVEKADIDGDREHEIFVYLLSWMLFFDSFVDTSMKVRMSYIEQLRSSSIIETHFIPSVLSLLNLGRGIVKAYKLDIWAVDEFYVQFYETGSFSGLQTFAAHLYYRALLTVPSLIYNWVVDCRDRQLSSTIASYTQSYFSPVLIRAELEHVKGPEAQSELVSESDENQLTVKVASGAVNEVTASYLVDEQQLEIRLRIPGDWPLHRIEIRDTKKVGVDDNRWRAWILGVQQTIWAQNGRILDGLALFKKNVAGHFQGQVECAICYS
ncbi:uncharacterized protein C8R40DRAFT_1173854 [Lentinula edodes]|uniref:uncharacterized protein n=1 Tax=Lentinula edodes TaxID=5353 RepID=UPI001E8ED509|nr:uncharacterized protein C8R40DRAFT_1173854 [Lentinula edodes]KAH7872118.1 hypothetical protein C8R40DRAFT_1173854 [Lentinula edodes]